MAGVLDNIVWHTLCGPHACYASGTREARRYLPGFPSIVAFPDMRQANLDALAPYAASGEQMYCDGWAGKAPAGWHIEAESIMCKMVWNGDLPATNAAPDSLWLGALDAAASLELATLTRPGPFTLRALELGEYLGVFAEGKLIAMAGARVCAAGYGEIGGVCTHPAFQGRGLARRLVLQLVRHQLLRGQTPFLRVMRDNDVAHELYRRMGFCDYRESVARMILRR